jgi:predicted dithiol-disulfide oxidoreductase (DUF899 family)
VALVATLRTESSHGEQSQDRDLPWERVEKEYSFDGPTGNRTLAELFDGRSKEESGEVFHTYSTYSRGVDMLNVAYHYLDLVPKGRDEDALKHTMEWVRRHDQYER